MTEQTGVPEAAPAPARRRGRGLAAVLLSGVVGAALVAIAAGLTWWSADYADSLTGPLTVTLSGASCVPELIPLALVALAGLGAALATGGVPRRLIGGVLLACGVAVAVRSAQSLGAAPAGLTGSLTRPADPVGAAQLHPAGPALAVLGGVLLSVAGVLVLLGVGARRLSARYDRTRYDRTRDDLSRDDLSRDHRTHDERTDPVGGARIPSGIDATLEQADWWKALDAGADPTANAAEPGAPTADSGTDRDDDRMDRVASGTGDSAGTDVEASPAAGSVTGSGTVPTRPDTTCASPEGTVSEQTSGAGYDDPQASRPT